MAIFIIFLRVLRVLNRFSGLFLDVSSQFEALYGKVEGCAAGRSQVPDARWSVSLVEASRVQAKRKEEEERVKRWGF